nr:MAG TPA: hypothetical protein [Caudoviricetes sp.]
MFNCEEKTACGAGTLQAEKDTISTGILADNKQIVKCAVSTKELSNYQKLIIRRLWFTSRERKELIRELKKLEFCTYSVAVKSLLEQELIDNEDYYSLMTEVER